MTLIYIQICDADAWLNEAERARGMIKPVVRENPMEPPAR
jgi:hypothetical protein